MNLYFLFYFRYLQKLREYLLELKKEIEIVELKGGTEIEDMDYREIYFLRQITRGIVPIKVKIGGVEARNDIRFCLENKIDVILAPMVESEYALKIFIQSVNDIHKRIQQNKESYFPSIGINIETAMAIKNFKKITNQNEFRKLSYVTIGRSDLSSSFGVDIMSNLVFSKTNLIINQLRLLKKNYFCGRRHFCI